MNQKMQNLKIISKKTKDFKCLELADAIYTELQQQDPLSAEFILVSEEEIRELNREHRGVDKVTDVLSFPTLDGIRGKVIRKEDFPYDVDKGRVFIGSIVICKERAKEQAKEYGHSEEREFNFLLCHGLLHLMGYDHMTDEDRREMNDLEDKIMKRIDVSR